MPGTSKAILVGACAALAFPVTIGAAAPALIVLASATMAGVIIVRSTPAEPQQWFSVQLLTVIDRRAARLGSALKAGRRAGERPTRRCSAVRGVGDDQLPSPASCRSRPPRGQTTGGKRQPP